MQSHMTPTEFAQEAARILSTESYADMHFAWVSSRLHAADSLRHIFLGTQASRYDVRTMSDVWDVEHATEVLTWTRERGKQGLSWVRDGWTSTASTGTGIHAMHAVCIMKVTGNEMISHDRAMIFKWVDEEAGEAEAQCAAAAVTEKTLRISRQITVGKQAVVARGRKVPVGTTGKVISILQGRFGCRVGIATSEVRVGGRYQDVVWTVESNVDMILDEAHVTSEAALAGAAAGARAKEAIRNGWLKVLEELGITREEPSKIVHVVRDGEEQ